MIAKSKSWWKTIAYGSAVDAHKNCFPSRRGIWLIADATTTATCVYNNNPYAGGLALRGAETANFRAWLKQNGIAELAYATYPPPGQVDAGYTYAMILDCGEERHYAIKKAMKDIVLASWDAIGARSKDSRQ